MGEDKVTNHTIREGGQYLKYTLYSIINHAARNKDDVKVNPSLQFEYGEVMTTPNCNEGIYHYWLPNPATGHKIPKEGLGGVEALSRPMLMTIGFNAKSFWKANYYSHAREDGAKASWQALSIDVDLDVKSHIDAPLHPLPVQELLSDIGCLSLAGKETIEAIRTNKSFKKIDDPNVVLKSICFYNEATRSSDELYLSEFTSDNPRSYLVGYDIVRENIRFVYSTLHIPNGDYSNTSRRLMPVDFVFRRSDDYIPMSSKAFDYQSYKSDETIINK